MTAFLFLFFLYIVPIWFTLRMRYFANKRAREYSWQENYETVDFGFAIFFICVVSWIGFGVAIAISGCKKSDVAQAFFLPYGRGKSMRTKMFFYKVRKFGLRLLFIKEPE